MGRLWLNITFWLAHLHEKSVSLTNHPLFLLHVHDEINSLWYDVEFISAKRNIAKSRNFIFEIARLGDVSYMDPVSLIVTLENSVKVNMKPNGNFTSKSVL